MPRKTALMLVCSALSLLAAGCPKPTPTMMRTRAEIGPHDDQAVRVALARTDGGDEDQAVYVCPWLVPLHGREFKTSEIKDGETNGAFGPMVPCGTVITERGLCPSCRNPVHLPGQRPIAVCPNLYIPEPGVAPSDGAILVDKPAVPCEEILGDEGAHSAECPKCGPTFTYFEKKPRITEPRISVEAVPAFRSPYAPDKVIDPVAVMLKGSEPAGEGKSLDRNDSNQCPYTKRYFEFEPSDVLEVIDFAEEVVEPIKETPVDPTWNYSPVAGTYRNVDDITGPCWRCGGVGTCPDCSGSGLGPTGIYGPAQPVDCWACTRPTREGPRSSGRCPECDGSGFTRYEGALPTNFTYFTRREGNLVAADSKSRNWQFPPRGASSGDENPGE